MKISKSNILLINLIYRAEKEKELSNNFYGSFKDKKKGNEELKEKESKEEGEKRTKGKEKENKEENGKLEEKKEKESGFDCSLSGIDKKIKFNYIIFYNFLGNEELDNFKIEVKEKFENVNEEFKNVEKRLSKIEDILIGINKKILDSNKSNSQ